MCFFDEKFKNQIVELISARTCSPVLAVSHGKMPKINRRVDFCLVFLFMYCLTAYRAPRAAYWLCSFCTWSFSLFCPSVVPSDVPSEPPMLQSVIVASGFGHLIIASPRDHVLVLALYMISFTFCSFCDATAIDVAISNSSVGHRP